ncbi:MAG: sulfotransferase [Planctomycetota bacterium]
MTAPTSTPTTHSTSGDITAEQQRTRDGIFFIVGTGRSGTSLLQSIVSAHPHIAMPGETKFFTVMTPRSRTNATFTTEAALDAELARLWKHWWMPEIGVDLDELRRDLAPALPVAPADILIALLTRYRLGVDRERVGEKSPGHLSRVLELAEMYPKARFVQIVRDPRAVALSLQEVKTKHKTDTGFGSTHFAVTVRDWSTAISQSRTYAKELPDRYHLLRYEDLVTEPARELRSITKFLELPWDDSLLRPEQRSQKGYFSRQAAHMSSTEKPLFTSSITRWREQLDPAVIGHLEAFLESDMVSLGYEPVKAGRSKLAHTPALLVSDTARLFERAVQRAKRG